MNSQPTDQVILKHLDETYGKLLTTLKESQLSYEKLLKEKGSVKQQFDKKGTSFSEGKYLEKSKETINQLNELYDKSSTLEGDVEKHLEKFNTTNQEIKTHVYELHKSKILQQYLKITERIEFFNSELEKQFKKGDDELCVTLFLNVSEIQRSLRNFNGYYIKGQISEVLNHWSDIIKKKLFKDFENLLSTIKWPFVSANLSLQSPPQSSIEKLQLICEYLLEIDMSNEYYDNVFSPEPVNVLSICSPIYLLIQPLKKRFLYHFYGNRQTNRNDKPEWYFTQILTWIRDHKEFVSSWFQPIANKLGYYHINLEVEFMEGLVNLAVEKLKADLPAAQYDDLTFGHMVDEALSFDKELRDTYDYPSEQSGVLAVLTQGAVLMKWIALEKKFAREKMDNLLSNSDPFEPLALDIDDLKVTVCADAFITLLKRITERYESLPQPGHRLLFAELQVELLDDFRIRFIQLANAEEGDVIESKIPAIANSLHYIENVLSDWGNMLHYLHLYHHKTELETLQENNDRLNKEFSVDGWSGLEHKSIFSDTITRYSHMRQDLLSTLTRCVMNEIKSKSRNYRNERWAAMEVPKDLVSLSVTSSACPMLERTATRLHQLNKYLSEKLFGIAWRTISSNIDEFLFDDLILMNRFNNSGALQLKYDITRNLFPIFSLYTEKSANYFPKLNESVIVLNLAKGSALLLQETLLALRDATGAEDTRKLTLMEMKIYNLEPKLVLRILSQRTDIEVTRRLNLD